MHGMVALLGFMSLPGYKATIRAILSQIFTSTKAQDVKFCVMSYLQVRHSVHQILPYKVPFLWQALNTNKFSFPCTSKITYFS